jgi:hypothetical protein
LLVAALLVAAVLAANAIADHYGIHWDSRRRGDPPGTQTQMPVWLQRVLIFSLAGGYIYFAVLPWILKKSPPGVGELWSKVFRAGSKKMHGDDGNSSPAEAGGSRAKGRLPTKCGSSFRLY